MVENKFQKLTMITFAYLILILLAAACIVPFLIVLSASFSSESMIAKNGYSVFVRGFTLQAYYMAFENWQQLFNAYLITIFVTLVGSIMSVLIVTLTAYPLSRVDYKWRNQVSFYLFFTMLFSGGAIPSYLLIANYLHLKNNILVLILPMLVSTWNIFLVRTYLSKVHISLVESAKIDGASEFGILFKIIIPISMTGIATVLLLITLGFWNEWYLCLMYMTKEKIITLQYYLYRILSNVDAMQRNAATGVTSIDLSTLPKETMRMAICVLASGPMLFVFMFFQKYFVRGIALGSVKG